jgi:hypothetical protein
VTDVTLAERNAPLLARLEADFLRAHSAYKSDPDNRALKGDAYAAYGLLSVYRKLTGADKGAGMTIERDYAFCAKCGDTITTPDPEAEHKVWSSRGAPPDDLKWQRCPKGGAHEPLDLAEGSPRLMDGPSAWDVDFERRWAAGEFD